MIAVFGSGFGIYGHLPAIVESGHAVAVPSRYRDQIETRVELRKYREAITFCGDEFEMLAGSEVAVLARRPADNEVLIAHILEVSRPSRIVVEKPSARTSVIAQSNDRLLTERGIRSYTPYLFQYTPWGRATREIVVSQTAETVSVDWSLNTANGGAAWKGDSSAGGGILSFYFIHMLALLYFLAPDAIIADAAVDDPGSRIAGSARIVARSERVRFDLAFRITRGENLFRVRAGDRLLADSLSPFGLLPARGLRDSRVDSLKDFYSSTVLPGTDVSQANAAILQLWSLLQTRRVAPVEPVKC